MTATGDIQPDPATWKWLVQHAAEHHGGSIPAAVITILQAARAAEQHPADPWADLVTRHWPPYRVPVAAIVEFIDQYDPARDGPTAQDVLDALTRALTRRPGDTRQHDA
jgi:hypothetical protein